MKKEEKKKKSQRRYLPAWMKSTPFLMSMILLVMIVSFSVITVVINGVQNFLTITNISNLLRQSAINGVIALGMTVVILTGGIDLSVGSVVGLAGVMSASLLSRGFGIFLSLFLTIVVCSLVGLINAVFIFEGKVPQFIATLGTMTSIRGLIMMLTSARTISGLPREFTSFANGAFLGLPLLFWVWILMAVITHLMLRFTTFGRDIFSIGSNTEAARLSGIKVRRATYGVYFYSSLMCSIAGIMLTARLGNGVPTGGSGYEVDAIASAVMGGTSMTGAEGSVVGTFIGALILQAFRNGGNILGLNPHLMQVVIGLVIVAAVIIDKKGKVR